MHSRSGSILCFFVGSTCTVLLSGCLTVPNLNAPTTPKPKDINDKVTTLLTMANTPIPAVNRTMSPSEYARVGYTQVREACDNFFTTLIQKSNANQLTKADWTALGTAAGVIIALTHASAAKPVGIAAAAFGLGSSAYDNYQKYALLTIYPEQTKTLVFKALDAYEASSPADASTDIIQADSRVSGFAAVCTYSNINVLAQNAIATSTVTPSTSTAVTLFTVKAELDKVAEIERLLGISSISDIDLATLDLLAKKQALDAEVAASQSTIVSSLSAPVAKVVWDGTNIITTAFTPAVATDLKFLFDSNPQFAKMVNDSIAKSKDASAAALQRATESAHAAHNPVPVAAPPPVFVPPVAAPQAWHPPTILLNVNGERSN